MKFQDFLTAFEAGIKVLESRSAAASQRPDLAPVKQAVNKAAKPARDEVSIGIGDADSDGICLSNKAHIKSAGWMPSVTDLVLRAPDDLWADWRTRLGEDREPARFFSRFTLLVEDASLDSCFALIAFIARMNDVPVEGLPSAWADYVNRFERGETLIPREVDEVYAPLHSALVHSFFKRDWPGAWVSALRLLSSCVGAGISPFEMASAPYSPQLSLARACLGFEKQSYQDMLHSAEVIQLLLPMQDPSDPLLEAEERSRLVDAMIVSMPIDSDGYKAHYRTDRTNSPMKLGFILQALHLTSSDSQRSGGNMTVSVMPESGLSLKRFWEAVERAENAAWERTGRVRPSNDPRKNMLSYPAGRDSSGNPSPNGPWYDGSPGYTYTLIASPWASQVPEKSLLDWSDVTEILWQTYNPYAGLRVSSRGHVTTLEQAEPVPVSNGTGRKLFSVKWTSEGEQTAADLAMLRMTPTLKRYLAAIVNRRAAGDTGPIRLADLASERGYTFLELHGGFAVITEKGAFVVDDFTPHATPIGGMVEEFRKAVQAIERIEEGTRKTARLIDAIEGYLRGKGLSNDRGMRREIQIFNALTGLKLEMTRWVAESDDESFDPDVARFRDALYTRWNIRDRLRRYYEAIEKASDTLRDHSDLRSDRAVAIFAIFGFPILVAASLLGFLFGDIDWPVTTTSVIVFLGVLAVGMTGVYLTLRLRRRAYTVSPLSAPRPPEAP